MRMSLKRWRRPLNDAIFSSSDYRRDYSGVIRLLDETIKLAQELRNFSALQIAGELGLSQQAANNRLKELVRNGALVRRRIVPERGGKEFLYAVPQPD
jgi:hypothetical protein